jgi:hypothetical protein
MRRLTVSFIACCVGLLLTVTPAYAKKKPPVYIPPQSAASQYTEDVPTAGGNTPSSGVNSGGGTSGATSSIPSKTVRQLNHSGTSGKAAASLAQSLAPSSATTRSADGITRTTASPAGAPAADVIKTLGGSGAGSGIGVLLPIILIISLIAATGLGILRLRRPPSE